MSALFSASQVNLLVYHYLKESGFHHACFALRHESRLDEEPLSHEAVVAPGRLIEVLEKGMAYINVEAHIDEDGNEIPCSVPMSIIGPDHTCDGTSKTEKGTDASLSAARLTPSPAPEPTVRFAERSVQTQNAERRSVSRASSQGPQAETVTSNGRSPGSEDRSSRVASTSKATLDTVEEESGAMSEGIGLHDSKRKADAKAMKAEKRVKRELTPKLNGRPAASADSDEAEKQTRAREDVAKDDSNVSVTPGKKNKRGSNVVKASAVSNGSSKSEKATSSTYLPPLTGQAKGKQISSSNIALLKGHSAEVFVTAWNPAVPGLLASGAGDATVRIWDLGPALSGKALGDAEPVIPTVCKHLPSTQAKDVSALSWNPDGTLLASGSYDGILRLWTPQGDLHLVMSMHQGPIFAVRWNRRGNYILTGSADGTAIVWDLNSGKVRQQFSSHSDTVLDSDWLTGAMDANLKEDAPSSAADNTLATCSADNSIKVLRLGEVKPLTTLKGHTDEVNAIRFDPTGTLLASVSDDATARIWNMDVILGLSGTSSNGSKDNETPGVSKRNSATPRPARGGSVDQMDVDESASVGDTSGGNLNDLLGHSLSNGGSTGSNSVCRFILTGHKKDIFAASWAPHRSGNTSDPRLLATASFDNTARIWNAEDGTCLRVFAEHTDSVYSVCFSPDRKYLVTGGIDQRLFISEVATGDIVLAHAAGGGVFDMAWHTEKPRKAVKEDPAKADENSQHLGSQSKQPPLANVSDADSRDEQPRHFLGVSQRDKMLTILDLSDL